METNDPLVLYLSKALKLSSKNYSCECPISNLLWSLDYLKEIKHPLLLLCTLSIYISWSVYVIHQRHWSHSKTKKGVMLLYVTGFNDLVLLISLTNTGELLDS